MISASRSWTGKFANKRHHNCTLYVLDFCNDEEFKCLSQNLIKRHSDIARHGVELIHRSSEIFSNGQIQYLNWV